MTKEREKGLTAEDIKRKNELVAELKRRFNDVEKAINQYNATVIDANDFIGGIFSLLDEYYNLRLENWKSSLNGESYEQFKEKWETTIPDIPDIEDLSSMLEGLPYDLSRPVKRPKEKIQLFRNKN